MTKAIVVGGGPAGASAALGLLKQGFEVSLIEKRTQWSGRVCGAFLNSEAIRHLEWLNVMEEVKKAGCVTVSKTSITSLLRPSSEPILFSFPTPGISLPRQALEEILLNEVRKKGGRIHMGSRVTSVDKSGSNWRVFIRQQTPPPRFELTVVDPLEKKEKADTLEAPLIVMAYGRFSFGEILSTHPQNGWYGWNATFSRVPQKPGELSLHFYPGGYVGIVTFNNGESNVCGLQYRTSETPLVWDTIFDQAVARQPGLKRMLSQSQRMSSWRGVGPLPFSTALTPSEGAILVGDAAAVGDPFIGEGIGRALAAGPMLATAIDLAKKKSSAQELSRIYASLWKKAYSKRLKMGSVFRKGLQHSRVGGLLSELLIKQVWIRQIVIPKLHVGFSAPLR